MQNDHRGPGSRSPAATRRARQEIRHLGRDPQPRPRRPLLPDPAKRLQRGQSHSTRVIGLCIDIGHTVRIGADLLGSIRKCGDRVFDLHIKDVTAATPQGKGTPVGRGIIDFPGLVRALIEVKFKGVAAFEYEEQPDDPLPGLAESVGYLKGVLAAI